jgi:hypothetical protein
MKPEITDALVNDKICISRTQARNLQCQEVDLNKLYKDFPCYLCGRKWPDTVLNIEGHIHHHEKLRCLDTKECQREVRNK